MSPPVRLRSKQNVSRAYFPSTVLSQLNITKTLTKGCMFSTVYHRGKHFETEIHQRNDVICRDSWQDLSLCGIYWILCWKVCTPCFTTQDRKKWLLMNRNRQKAFKVFFFLFWLNPVFFLFFLPPPRNGSHKSALKHREEVKR